MMEKGAVGGQSREGFFIGVIERKKGPDKTILANKCVEHISPL